MQSRSMPACRLASPVLLQRRMLVLVLVLLVGVSHSERDKDSDYDKSDDDDYNHDDDYYYDEYDDEDLGSGSGDDLEDGEGLEVPEDASNNVILIATRHLSERACLDGDDSKSAELYPGRPLSLRADLRYRNVSGKCKPFLEVSWKAPLQGVESLQGFFITFFYTQLRQECAKLKLRPLAKQTWPPDNISEITFRFFQKDLPVRDHLIVLVNSLPMSNTNFAQSQIKLHPDLHATGCSSVTEKPSSNSQTEQNESVPNISNSTHRGWSLGEQPPRVSLDLTIWLWIGLGVFVLSLGILAVCLVQRRRRLRWFCTDADQADTRPCLERGQSVQSQDSTCELCSLSGGPIRSYTGPGGHTAALHKNSPSTNVV